MVPPVLPDYAQMLQLACNFPKWHDSSHRRSQSYAELDKITAWKGGGNTDLLILARRVSDPFDGHGIAAVGTLKLV